MSDSEDDFVPRSSSGGASDAALAAATSASREKADAYLDKHAALIDLQMPNMTGLQLQQYLADTGINIPTIIITAHDESGSRDRCMAIGASAYMIKPLRKTALLAAIDAAITMPM